MIADFKCDSRFVCSAAVLPSDLRVSLNDICGVILFLVFFSGV